MKLRDRGSESVDSPPVEPSVSVSRFLDDAARARWSMSPAMQARYARFRATVLDVTQLAISMREAARDSRLDVWRLRLGQCSASADRDTVYELALGGALSINSADFANIQLYDSSRRGLVLCAHRGFAQPFLDFFAFARADSTACGMAARERRSVVVQDVLYSPIFIGTDALAVLLEAEVRAVMSTPMIGDDGRTIGVISVHYRRPRTHIDSELVRFEALARTVARIIEGKGRVARSEKL